jgi:hypothetical protein
MAPDFEIRIPGNCLEIAVVVPNRHTIFDRDRGDEAIQRRADG